MYFRTFYISKSNPWNEKIKCSQIDKKRILLSDPTVIFYILTNNLIFWTSFCFCFLERFLLLSHRYWRFFSFSSSVRFGFLSQVFFSPFFFLSFREILISFVCFFSELSFLILIIFIWYFCLQKKKLQKNALLVFLYALKIVLVYDLYESLKITWDCLKSLKKWLNCFKDNNFVLESFLKNFREYLRMENSNCKSENIETKYLKNMRKNRFLKVKNSLFKIRKSFYKIER